MDYTWESDEMSKANETKEGLHARFKKELKELQPQIFDEIEIIDTYIGANIKIRVKDKYGICWTLPSSLKRGHRPTIKSAINPKQYFINKFKELQPELSKIVEIVDDFSRGNNEYIIVRLRHGLCRTKMSSLLAGICPSIDTALDKTEFFKNKLKEARPNLYNNIEIVGNYTRIGSRIRVSTKYGICTPRANDLLSNGWLPNIESAENKTEYFINEINDLQPNLCKNIEFVGEYKSGKRNILVRTKYGLCNGNIGSMKKGIIPTRKSAIDKHAYFMNEIKELNPYVHNQVELIGKYINSDTRILAKDRYGLLSLNPKCILSGDIPTIHVAVDKKIYWIEKAKEVHGDKYDYSDTKYSGWDSYVSITCKIHNEKPFIQKASDHLAGCGCSECAKLTKGWTKTNFISASKSNGVEEDCTLYVISCNNKDTGEKFVKIGITTNSVEKRYYSRRTMPYDYQIDELIKGRAGEIYDLEKRLLKSHKKEGLEYQPKIFFEGHTECFTKFIKDFL